MEFSFERLIVWQKSRLLVKEVYQIISTLPYEEKFGLSNQLRRAVISVASNIAEGSGRISLKEKIHFTEIAYGSLMEVMCQLILAVDLGLVRCESLDPIRLLVSEIGSQLSAYRRSLIKLIDSNQ